MLKTRMVTGFERMSNQWLGVSINPAVRIGPGERHNVNMSLSIGFTACLATVFGTWSSSQRCIISYAGPTPMAGTETPLMNYATFLRNMSTTDADYAVNGFALYAIGY